MVTGIEDDFHSIFGSLSATCAEEFIGITKIRKFEKGTILVKEGQYAQDMFFIVSGSAKAFYLKDGKCVIDWFAFENNFICSLESFFEGRPSPCYISLIETSILLSFHKDSMLELFDKHRDFERIGRLMVTKTMLQLQKRIMSLQFESAMQRYENLLKMYPNIIQRVPLGDIASFLGITQETLSRVRAGKK